MAIYIDPTAHVSEQAHIGEGTRIWINAQVREDAVLGAGCNIGKDTYIDVGVCIGDRVKIQNGVSVYHGVTVENDVFIGPNAAFTNDFYPRAFCDDFAVKPTLVREGASIGANATIVCGNTLGRFCMVGSGSVVTHDVPDYTLVAGNPARPLGFVCRCGCRLPDPGQPCEKCGFILPLGHGDTQEET